MSKLVIDTPRILLAPMEGVMESVMRDMLTRIGGYERCVTEFVRVSSTVLPPKVFIGCVLSLERRQNASRYSGLRSITGFRSCIDGIKCQSCRQARRAGD